MTSSRKADASAERDALAVRAREALRDAHTAARAASDAYAAKAPRNAQEFLAEPIGFARVTARSLRPSLRNILKACGVLTPAHGGGWIVADFQDHAHGDGVKAREVSCRAACDVLRERLSEDGSFGVEAFLD